MYTTAHLDLRVELEALLREIERARFGACDRCTVLDEIAQRSSHGVILCDEDGSLVANRAAERMWLATDSYGASDDRYLIIGKNGVRECVASWARSRPHGDHRGDSSRSIELPIERRDGSRAVVLANCATTKTQQGSVTVCAFAEIRPSRDAAESAQAAHYRASFLAQATTKLLGAPLDPEETLRQLAALTVPAIADGCVIDVVDEKTGRVRRAVQLWADKELEERARIIDQRYSAARNEAIGLAHVIRTGVAEFHGTVTETLLSVVATDPEHLTLLRSLGLRSAMFAPLRSRQRVIGAICLLSTDPAKHYDSSDLDMARQLADSGGLAIENARLYQNEQQARTTIERTAERMQRLQTIMTELGLALTLDDVARAVVDHGVAAVEASAGEIWMLDEPHGTTRLVRMHRGRESAGAPTGAFELDSQDPLGAAIETLEPVFVGSPDELVERYPTAAERHSDMRAFACFPLVVQSKAVGVLVFSFEGPRTFAADERAFLLLVADHCAEGFYRAMVYEAEQRARSETELLYRLLDSVNRATTVNDVYGPALDVVERALGVSRSSILLFDDDGVMRFKASRGISAEYQRALEGHSPWTRDTKNPAPLFVVDAETDPGLAPHRETLRAEGIRALGFLPLVHRGQLLGKFMVYSAEPRVFSFDEMRLARTIAAQVSHAVARKRSEAEVESALEAAEYASRMKDEFLAIVSHELRTPLSAITGWSAILQTDRRNDPATLAKGLTVIDRNAKAQATLIDDILDMSRIIRGKLVLDAHPISLVPVVVDTIESLKTSASVKQIEVNFDLGDDRFELVGDPERLRQIAWNLLSNAIKFTASGGRVDVRLRRDLGAVVLEVEDTGRGITPEFLPYVFDRFRQADGSTTRREGGLGLGLSIVRQLVELHGGQVGVRSAGRAKGSTFTAQFPVRAVVSHIPHETEFDGAPRHAVAPETPREHPDLAGVRVLVVDDQPDAREMVKEALTSFGALVEVAGSVSEALDTLASFRPTVLVTDIGMPDEDGYALLRRVRALPGPTGRIPAVAMTAYARAEDIRHARQAGFQSHVAKPTYPDALARAVAQALAPNMSPMNALLG